MPLFEIAIIEIPTKKEVEEDGAKEKLIMPPTFVMAPSADQAALNLAMDGKIPSDTNRDKMKVLVRPFV